MTIKSNKIFAAVTDSLGIYLSQGADETCSPQHKCPNRNAKHQIKYTLNSRK